jgi:hypothetical protein
VRLKLRSTAVQLEVKQDQLFAESGNSESEWSNLPARLCIPLPPNIESSLPLLVAHEEARPKDSKVAVVFQ